MFKDCVKLSGAKLLSVPTGPYGERCLVVEINGKKEKLSGIARDVYKGDEYTGYMIRDRKDGTFWAYTYAGTLARPVLIGLVSGLEDGYTAV